MKTILVIDSVPDFLLDLHSEAEREMMHGRAESSVTAVGIIGHVDHGKRTLTQALTLVGARGGKTVVDPKTRPGIEMPEPVTEWAQRCKHGLARQLRAQAKRNKRKNRR
jgi:hypothetical protein